MALTAVFQKNVSAADLNIGPTGSVNIGRNNPENLKGLEFNYGIALSGEEWTLSLLQSKGSLKTLGNTWDKNVLNVQNGYFYINSFPVDTKTEKEFEIKEALLKRYLRIANDDEKNGTVSLGVGLGLIQVQTATKTTYRYQPDETDLPGLTIVNPKYRNSTTFTSTEIPIGSIGLRLKSPLPGNKAILAAEYQQTFRLGSKKDVEIDPLGMSMVVWIGFPFK
ncbi:MAG: hypothetical protein Q7S73_00510 [bacterium]|nr:hypothetical protein [bacterium]